MGAGKPGKEYAHQAGSDGFWPEMRGTVRRAEKRLALVATLLMPADILILDEPTNHLDNSMADWLEDYLKKWKGALIMVTHDRYFLDSVANRIIEIDKGNIYSYQANYEGYLAMKAERKRCRLRGRERGRPFLGMSWPGCREGQGRVPRNRRPASSVLRSLRMPMGRWLTAGWEMGSVSSRMGRTTVELSHISKAYGEKKADRRFLLCISENDRVGFIGPNGCGKRP